MGAKDPEIDQVVFRFRAASRAYQDACQERDRTIVKLAKVDGLSRAEIANRVELSTSGWR